MPTRRLVVVAALLAGLAAVPAYAGKPVRSSTPATFDVSYPQCGGSLPGGVEGGIVGVNDGIVLSGNPCLATEYAWAAKGTVYAPAFYANTADPGPAYSSHWPTGQTSPQVCAATDPNSAACSYDYGWNYAKDALARALQVTAGAASAPWWLDVETGNSWETLESGYGQTPAAQADDSSSIAGALDELRNAGVATIGVYSTSYQWSQITGSSGTQFATVPVWIAGTGSLSTAQGNCAQVSFTGGRVTLTQYAKNGFDADWHCS